MSKSNWFQSAVGFVLPLLMVISLRADDLAMLDHATASTLTAAIFQPDFGAGIPQATSCFTQPNGCCGALQASACCPQPNYCCGLPQAANSCSQPNCGSQPNCCCNLCCCTGSGFVGGAEVAFLRPYFNNDVALQRFSLTPPSESTIDFTRDYEASPRLWLGYVGCCGFGGRIRYWEYDQGANSQTGLQPDQNVFYFTPGISIGGLETNNAGDTVAASEHLHMYTLDAEVTQCMQLCCWDFVFGAGLRDAAVHIDRFNSYTPVGNTTPIETASIGNHFDGLGPTLFTEFRRPFGCGGLAFVGNLRGSLLYGTKSLRGTDVTAVQTQTYDQSADGCLGVAELSLGVEWAKEISCNTIVYVQGLWENQIWDNMGNSTNITGDNLGLGGFTLAVGLVR